jgi:DtxR family transcriptional regulator, Mn-dependent transcriptional regulator
MGRITNSQQDYLKIIWHLEQERKKATVKVVADNLGVKSPTVLSMFHQLEKSALITYNKSEGARLSLNGENNARKLVRKHRLIETFLETVLGMDEQHIHDEAEKLEHVISDQLMHRIDAYLGFPDKDPHGSAIPVWDKEAKRTKLSEAVLGDSFTIKEVHFTDLQKEYYAGSDFSVGALWTMSEIPPGDSCFLISNGKQFLAIPAETADKIWVMLKK